MARPDIGTKRVCPETGRKFYDLNKDPIVSPYTGASYPRSYFEAGGVAPEEEEAVAEKELETEAEGPEIVSLEDAEEDDSNDDALPGIEDEEDVEIDDSDDDTFLAADEEDDDDVSGIIGVGEDDDET